MSGTFQETLTETRGAVAPPTDIDATTVVIGCASGFSGQSPFYSSGPSAVTALGSGDGVDTLCQMIEQPSGGGAGNPKKPVAFYGVPSTTPGSYGTIDVTGITGTALVSVNAATLPTGTGRAAIKFIAGGLVGTAGITYQTCADYGSGNSWSRTYALGTADYVTIPALNARFNIGPSTTDLTALNTLINEEFVDFNAHVVLTTGTVHTNADTVDQVSSGTYPSATNTATRVARINALVIAARLHTVKGTGGSPATHINAGGDAAGLTALNAIPLATDDESALAAALAFKAWLNTHDAGTTWHTIADATNTVTSPAPSTGTLLAGDVAAVRTFAPAPVAADLDTAFQVLATDGPNFAIVVVEMPMTRALLAHVTAGLDACRDVGKRLFAIVRSRLPDFENAETEQTWAAAVEAEFDSYNDSRIHVVTEYGYLTDAMTGNVYMRSGLAQDAADWIRVSRSEYPNSPHDILAGMSNFSIVNAAGARIAHDEGPRGSFTGMSDEAQGNRLGCVQRLKDQSVGNAVYKTFPWVLYAPGEQIFSGMDRRVANAMERVVLSAMIRTLGSKIFYSPADPNVSGSRPMLRAQTRDALHGAAFAALAEFANDIQNADDANTETGLVQVSPYVVINSGKAAVSIDLSVRFDKYLTKLTITYSAKD